MDIFSIAVGLARVEEGCIGFRKQIADGNMIKGHTAKDSDKIDLVSADRELQRIEGAVAALRAEWTKQTIQAAQRGQR